VVLVLTSRESFFQSPSLSIHGVTRITTSRGDSFFIILYCSARVQLKGNCGHQICSRSTTHNSSVLCVRGAAELCTTMRNRCMKKETEQKCQSNALFQVNSVRDTWKFWNLSNTVITIQVYMTSILVTLIIIRIITERIILGWQKPKLCGQLTNVGHLAMKKEIKNK